MIDISPYFGGSDEKELKRLEAALEDVDPDLPRELRDLVVTSMHGLIGQVRWLRGLAEAGPREISPGPWEMRSSVAPERKYWEEIGNGQLIAASPMLHGAAKKALAALEAGADASEAVAALRVAIGNAEGKPR